MIVGSRQWCEYWATFYRARAHKMAARGFRYPMDDVNCWEYLFMAEMWATTEPWAKEQS